MHDPTVSPEDWKYKLTTSGGPKQSWGLRGVINTSAIEEVSPERYIWSLCVFAWWWLWGMAVVGSPPPPPPSSSVSFCAGSTWGALKSMKTYQIHKIHAPKIQVCVCFFWGRQSAAGSCDTAANGLGVALKSLTNDKIHKIHTPKIQGCVFSEVAEVPQAAGTQRRRAGRPWNRQKK